MKIRLINFRKYEDQSYDLSSNVLKISGDSGSGKSTIFEAIFWCLYGNLRNIKRKSASMDDKTQVILGTEIIYHGKEYTCTITRRSSHDITVNLDDNSGSHNYTSDEAQHIINDWFGTQEFFLLASYLRAECMHKLVTSSPAEKREIASILFPGAISYSNMKDKIVTLKKTETNTYNNLSLLCSKGESALEALKNANPWLDTIQSIDSVSNLETQLRSLMIERANIINVNAAITATKEHLLSIPDIIDTTELESELTQISDKLTSTIVDVKSKEEKIAYYTQLLSGLQKEQHEMCINIPVSEIDRLISVVDRLLAIAPSLAILNNKITDIKSVIDIEKSTLAKYESSYINICYNKKLDEVLKCPSCSCSLVYSDRLEKYDGDSLTKRYVEIDITESQLKSQRLKLAKIDDTRLSLVTNYSTYSEIISSEKNQTGIDLQVLDLPNWRSSLIRYSRVLAEIKLIETKLTSINSDSREHITPEIKHKYTSRQEELRQIISRNTYNRELREKLQKKLDSYPDLQSVDIIEKQIDDIKDTLSRVKIVTLYSDYKRKYDALLVKKNESEELLADIAQASTILDMAYNTYVQKHILSIQRDMSMLGKLFFDKTMNISIESSKGDGMSRPTFDIKVEYGDMYYDDVRNMSTGEKKRLSIILMIVLTKHTGGRIMLLDEAFSSINIETRGIILNELGKLNIPIYITSHDDIPGGYEYELSI